MVAWTVAAREACEPVRVGYAPAWMLRRRVAKS